MLIDTNKCLLTVKFLYKRATTSLIENLQQGNTDEDMVC